MHNQLLKPENVQATVWSAVGEQKAEAEHTFV